MEGSSSDTLTRVGGNGYGREELAAERPPFAQSRHGESKTTCRRRACGSIVHLVYTIVLTARIGHAEVIMDCGSSWAARARGRWRLCAKFRLGIGFSTEQPIVIERSRDNDSVLWRLLFCLNDWG
jgi:hypothetical protein